MRYRNIPKWQDGGGGIVALSGDQIEALEKLKKQMFSHFDYEMEDRLKNMDQNGV
jgi:hypothetical protein